MATNITATMAAAGQFIPEIFSKEIIVARENNLVLANLVERYDSDVQNKGDIIRIPNLSSITATYKVENTDVAQSATTETASSITINKHAVARVTIEDMAAIQSHIDLRSKYTTQLGKAIAKITDTDIRNLYSGFSKTVGAGATSTDLKLAKSYILEGIRYLNSKNAPFEDRAFVVESFGYRDLLNTDDFVRYDAVGQGGDKNATMNAKIGKLYGVDVFQSEQVYTLSSVAYAMLFQKSAIGLAVQKAMRVQAEYSVPALAWDLVADSLYGVAELRDDHGLCIRYGQVA
jgi:hypothetical protein